MLPALRFLSRFIQSPRRIGSITPSSPALVRTMLLDVRWDEVGAVAELGAGTGVITREIDALRPASSHFLCFENDPHMKHRLAREFPAVRIEDDAFRLPETLAAAGVSGLDCVVSGLPLVNFSPHERCRLLADIHRLLNPGGVFVAFQYTRQLQGILEATYDQVDRQYVWANLPPAFVFVCRKSLVSRASAPPRPARRAPYESR